MAIVDINAKFTAQSVEDSNSKKNMVYTSDSGALYIVQVTENLGESFGFLDVTSADIGLPFLPQGFRMRKIHATDSTGKVSQSFNVGNATESIYVEGGTITVARKGSSAGLVLAATGVRGESRRLISANDSGQTSGDDS